nr:PREDICTED: cytochrome P450 71A1-like isoform X2 [Daucus carota subsp. sativus]
MPGICGWREISKNFSCHRSASTRELSYRVRSCFFQDPWTLLRFGFKSKRKILQQYLNLNSSPSQLETIKKNQDTELPLATDNLKAIMSDMFAAVTDTTFITLDWGMTALIINPRVMQKAQAEVRKVVGKRRVVLESDLHLTCIT